MLNHVIQERKLFNLRNSTFKKSGAKQFFDSTFPLKTFQLKLLAKPFPKRFKLIQKKSFSGAKICVIFYSTFSKNRINGKYNEYM